MVYLEGEAIGLVEEDKEGLQLVITIATSAVNMQEEVEFGRSWPPLGHERMFHSLITNLSRVCGPVKSMAVGSSQRRVRA